MKMLLLRQPSADGATLGDLWVEDPNGVSRPECVTLEDVARPKGVKIFGKTCIPSGTYNVVVTMSPRFRTRLPLLENVKGFEGVRIHTGNTPEDTEGCILVGQVRGVGRIERSRLAFEPLFRKIENALARGEKVTLEIRNPEE